MARVGTEPRRMATMKRTAVLILVTVSVIFSCAPQPVVTPLPDATPGYTDTPSLVRPHTGTPAPTATPRVVNPRQISTSDLLAILTSQNATLLDAFLVTQEILTRGGVAIGDLQNTFVPPYTPASSLVLTPRQALQLAQEAHSGPSVWRMDLAELGQMLADLGWPSDPGGPTVGEQLASLWSAWYAQASKDPNNPENATPTVLIALARHREPDLDFSTGKVAPHKIRLGMLETVLLIAAFDRLIPPHGPSSVSSLHLASLLPASQVSPCKPFQDSLFGRLAYEGVGGFVIQWATGKALEKGLEAAGISEWGQEKIGRAMFALGMFARVMRAVLLTTYVRIRASIEGDTSVHKPPEGEQLLKVFHAQAGIPPNDWQAYRDQFGKGFHDAVRDCLSWLGVSTYTLDDLVGEMDSWAIEWHIEKGSEPHVQWSPHQQIVPGQVHQGYWRTPLTRSGSEDVVGKSSFVVEVRNEKEEDHPGMLFKAPVKVCAYLDVARKPNFSTFVQAATGGLAGATDSAVELMQGMIEKLAKPRGCPDRDLEVTYHTDCITALWYLQQGALNPEQEVLDRLRKCLTFELKFESHVDMVGDRGGRYQGTAESTIRLQLDPADLTIKGRGPLNLVSARWEVPGCSTHTTTAPGTFEVFKLEFAFLRRIQTDEVVVQDLRLVYNPGGDDATRATETTTLSCPGLRPVTIPGPFWLPGYAVPRQSELSTPEGFVASGWHIQGGQEYARKEWTMRGQAAAAITESGHFVLYHRPEE